MKVNAARSEESPLSSVLARAGLNRSAAPEWPKPSCNHYVYTYEVASSSPGIFSGARYGMRLVPLRDFPKQPFVEGGVSSFFDHATFPQARQKFPLSFKGILEFSPPATALIHLSSDDGQVKASIVFKEFITFPEFYWIILSHAETESLLNAALEPHGWRISVDRANRYAISSLRGELPRPATGAEIDTLPRPAGKPGLESRNLPKPALPSENLESSRTSKSWFGRLFEAIRRRR